MTRERKLPRCKMTNLGLPGLPHMMEMKIMRMEIADLKVLSFARGG